MYRFLSYLFRIPIPDMIQVLQTRTQRYLSVTAGQLGGFDAGVVSVFLGVPRRSAVHLWSSRDSKDSWTLVWSCGKEINIFGVRSDAEVTIHETNQNKSSIRRQTREN